ADNSIGDQLGVIAAFARDHEMIHVDDIMLEGVTGSVPGARSDIDSLIERKRLHDDFDVVVVQDTTRLTRSGPQHAASLEYGLGCVGIELVYALDEIPTGDVGDVMKAMLHMSGRQQAKSISMASARGSMSSLQQGRSAHCRRPPYGIDRLYLSPDGTPNHIIRNLADGSQVMLDPQTTAVIRSFRRNERTGAPNHYVKQKDERVQLVLGDADRVDTVRRIYQRHHVDNWGYPRIARELNDKGIPSPTGKLWYVATVRSILLNPIYVGLGIANRISSAIYHKRAPDAPTPVHTDTRTLAHGKRPPTRTRPRSEWHEREEPAVTDLLGPEVKAMAKEKHERHLDELAAGRVPVVNKDRHRSSEYLLKGILTSKQGGYPMTGRPTGRKPYRKRYYAVSRAFSAPKSGDSVLRKLVPAEPLEQIVLAIVQTMLLRVPDIRDRIKDTIRKQYQESVVTDADLAELKKRRDSVTRKLEFALEELDDVGREAVRGKLKKWQAELRAIDERIRRTRPAAALNGEDVETATDAILDRITTFAKSMDDLPAVAVRRLLEAVVHRAVVDLETRSVEIELRLPAWLMDGSKPMCLDTAFACKTDIETHHENGVSLMKMRLLWLRRSYAFGGFDFADAA
ncbi:MAG: recombinase family protein, partial [Planctomycetes bacterium]|nr:recombinase family protein [Planctomycetota bacterium]